jgi:hypothetical protein
MRFPLPTIMGLFSLKWFSLFVFIFASTITYNYVSLHKLSGSFPHVILWDMLERPHSEPFHLSPHRHVHRRPELRRYEMILATQVRWPDGVEKTVITVNGEYISLFRTSARIRTVRFYF